MEVVKTLISQGCFVDFQDRHGNTPLHVACKDGNVPIVMALCETSCNLDVTNKVKKAESIFRLFVKYLIFFGWLRFS